MQIHEFTEAQYDNLFAKFDDVAELLKIQGEMPLAKLVDYLKHASVSELEPKDFAPSFVIDSIENDYRIQLSLVEEIRELADSDNDYATVAMMEDHAGYYSKTLWFVRQMKINT